VSRKINILIMTNFKKLSRNELKNVFGGQSCSLTIQGSDGQWITRTGTCKTKTTLITASGGIAITDTSSYCETGIGQVPLSSNGGTSRCS
jgi:hypothetical protein